MALEDRAYNKDGMSGMSGGGGPKFIFPMPTKLTFGIILACVILFFVQAFTPLTASFQITTWGWLTFHDALAFKQPWRWITYQYLHGSGRHIFFNLLSIYFLLPMLERFWGWKRTLAFYTAGGIAAACTFGLMCAFLNLPAPLVGASGCVLAIIGALAAVAPDAQILLLVIPITMRTLALLYAVLYTLTVVGDRNLSDAAHVGGLAFGYLAPRFGLPLWHALSRGFGRRVKDRRVRLHEQAEREDQALVDRILQKVHDSGMNSLTRSERKALARATEQQRRRDAEVAKLRGKGWR